MTPQQPTKLWNRNFSILWAGLIQSYLGDAFLGIGLMWLAFEMTGSVTIAATILALEGLPKLLGPLAGAVVDRVDRQRLMIGSDLICGVVLIGLFAAQTLGVLQIWHLYVLVLILGTASIFYGPSLRTLVPLIVPDSRLPAANSLIQGSRQLSMIVGTSLAGVVLAVAGSSLALLLDGISFLVIAASLLFVRFPKQAQSAELKLRGLLADMLAGLRFIFGTHEVLVLTGLAFFINLVLSPVNVIFPVFSQTLGADVTGFGLLASAISIGLLAGSTTTGLIADRLSYTWMIILGLVGMALALICLSFVQSLVLALLFAGLLGMMAPIIQVPLVSRLQRSVPRNYQGRVFASLEALISLSLPLAAGLAGGALMVLPVSQIFRVGALGVLLVAAGWLLLHLIDGRKVGKAQAKQGLGSSG